MTKPFFFVIITIRKRKEIKTMAKQTRGYYKFEDDFECWVNGFSAREKANYIREHGKIVKFKPM